MKRFICLSIVLVMVFLSVGCKRSDDELIPGMAWTMNVANPVLSPNSEPATNLYGWYNKHVSFPWVIKDASLYRMWFTATNTLGEDRIGYASSANGEDWTVYDNPVLDVASPASWDSGGVWNQCVIEDGSDYKMFYTGYNDSTPVLDRIGLAYSSDGLVWTREALNPVIGAGPSGSWYEIAVHSGTVLTSGTTYRMWLSGEAADGVVRTGYTTSTDCINWNTPQLVLDAGPESYDIYGAFFPCVVFDGHFYHMWYSSLGGSGQAFCYATSADGIAWAKHGMVGRDSSPLPWEDDYFVTGCVILDMATFRIWYSAASSADGTVSIGYGTSPAPSYP